MCKPNLFCTVLPFNSCASEVIRQCHLSLVKRALAFKQCEMSHDGVRGFLKAGCVFALMSCSHLD